MRKKQMHKAKYTNSKKSESYTKEQLRTYTVKSGDNRYFDFSWLKLYI